jgi:hypothetical protein
LPAWTGEVGEVHRHQESFPTLPTHELGGLLQAAGKRPAVGGVDQDPTLLRLSRPHRASRHSDVITELCQRHAGGFADPSTRACDQGALSPRHRTTRSPPST